MPRVGGDTLMDTEQTTNLDDEAIKGLLIEALQTDGAHHKQYLLWRIAEMLDLDLSDVSDDLGVAH